MRAKEFTINEGVNLFEINMSPSSLQQLASGIDAHAGMEFEMYVPTTSFAVATAAKTNDEFVESFDQIVEFFLGPNNLKTLNRVVDKLNYEYKEWVEKTFDSFFEKNKEHYATIIAKKLTTQDASVIVRELTRGGMDTSSLDNIKDEKVKNKIIADYVIEYGIDPYYEDALNAARTYRTYYTFNSIENWLNSRGYTHMSNIAEAFGLIWPTVSLASAAANDENTLKNIGQSFAQSIGRKVNVSSTYHGADRNPNEYALEPDGSLNYPEKESDIGIEFVSPPLPVTEILADLRKVKQWASQNNCYTKTSTGLHINVSVPALVTRKTSPFGPDQTLDYVKLALLLGDEHVLKQFGRLGNKYAQSAAKIVKNAAKDKVEFRSLIVPKLLDQMRSHLKDLASNAIHNGITEKFVSIHPKDGYIEFRSPGGDWLDENFDLIENTLLRFVVALDAACDPEKYREEYLTKLYKILQPTSTDDPIAVFAKYAAGMLPKQDLIGFARERAVTRETNKYTQLVSKKYNDQGNWVIYDNRRLYGSYGEIKVVYRFAASPNLTKKQENALIYQWARLAGEDSTRHGIKYDPNFELGQRGNVVQLSRWDVLLGGKKVHDVPAFNQDDAYHTAKYWFMHSDRSFKLQHANDELEVRLRANEGTENPRQEKTTKLDELDEGWKDWVAGAAIGAGVIGGGGAYLSNKTVEPPPNPVVTGKITQATPQQPNPMAKVVARPAAEALISAAKKAGISGVELAQLLAQCAHESANFTRFKEQGNNAYFNQYDIRYNPRKAKILGNVKKGDGIRYHGRGYIQLTGRDNYKRVGEALGLPLEANPALAEQPEIAARIAIWYWKSRVQPKVGDFSNTAEVTKPINAGLKGLDDRHKKFTNIVDLMKDQKRL
jgi:predicted chitinase